MKQDRFHFEIPKENIRNEKYDKTGGGKSFNRENHNEHGLKLTAQTTKLKEVELSKVDADLTSDLFFQIETPDELSIKSEKFKLEKLGLEIISYSNENKSIGTAKFSKNNLAEFEKRVAEYTQTKDHVGKSYFSVLEDITSIPVESKIKAVIDFDKDEAIPIIINLFNALSKKERFAINQKIIEEVSKYSKDVNIRNFRNGITSIECKLLPKEIPLVVKEFSTIKEIRPNYTALVENSVPVQAMPNPLKIGKVLSDSIICVIDSGINVQNNIFGPLVVAQVPFLPIGSTTARYDHGSFVASRCLFGDDVDACLGTHELNPYCKVLDVQVFGKDFAGSETNPTEFHLRSTIEEIVLKEHQRIKVYNLSLGGSMPIADFVFSDLAKLLDYLSKTFKVLFVISSGNMNSLAGNYPSDHFSHSSSRIGCPAESILSLTVGSIAKYKIVNSLASVGEISPFSRIGPGADLGVKPELVAHGGNLVSPYTYHPRVSSYGISADGLNLCADNGTSYSAPIISQFAQRLFDSYPNSDPNLVKALLCHFAKTKSIPNEIVNGVINYTGFGEPDIEQALTAGNYNAAYIYEGQLDQDNYQYINFHIPTSLSQNNKASKLKVKITITYDPPVNPDNDMEYSQTRIAAALMKKSDVGMKEINITGDDKYNLPWNPIIKFEKSFTRSYLTGGWDLRLRLYTRGNVVETYVQDYAVVIEILDESNKLNVYDEILKEFGGTYKKINIKLAA